MAAKRAKKKGGARPRAKRREALPVLEVDVDDEAALSVIAEQMAAAIVGAIVEKARRSSPKKGANVDKARRSPAKKAPAKRKRAAKSR